MDTPGRVLASVVLGALWLWVLLLGFQAAELKPYLGLFSLALLLLCWVGGSMVLGYLLWRVWTDEA